MDRDRSFRNATLVVVRPRAAPLPDDSSDLTPGVLAQLALENPRSACLLDDEEAQLTILRACREDLLYAIARHAAFHRQHASTSSVIGAVLRRGAVFRAALLENDRTDWRAWCRDAPELVAQIVDPYRLAELIAADDHVATLDERLRLARAALSHTVWSYPELRDGPLAFSCHVGEAVVELLREVVRNEGREALPRLARLLLPGLHVTPLYIDCDAADRVDTRSLDAVAEHFLRFVEDVFQDCRADLSAPEHPHDVERARTTLFGIVLVAGALREFLDGDTIHEQWLDRLLGSPSLVVRSAVYALAYDLVGPRPRPADVEDFDAVLIGAGPAGVLGMASHAAYWAAARSGLRMPAQERADSLRWIGELAAIPADSDAVIARTAFVREMNSVGRASDWLNPWKMRAAVAVTPTENALLH